jgi:acetamidase/formamidase
MAHHDLAASAQNCHWGYFDATRAPVLTITSGDLVTIDTVSGAPGFYPKSGFHVPPELKEIHAANPGYPLGPHILTGPVAVEGAKPGQVLEVRIRDIKLLAADLRVTQTVNGSKGIHVMLAKSLLSA